MIAIYALGMGVSSDVHFLYIRSITGATNRKRSEIAIIQLHKFYISHSFNCISIKSENCDIHYKYNIKFVDELFSILSVNCLQFCR